MELAGYVALSRLAALQRSTDVAAHNLANANTPGFKPERMRFADFLLKDQTRTGSQATRPQGDRQVRFVQDLSAYRDFTPAQISSTGNSFDLAISGEGFFSVQTEAGERFTRNGRFTLDPQGMLVTADGARVLNSERKPIQVPPDQAEIKVAADGTMTSENGPFGKLRIVNFKNAQSLNSEGANRYVATQEDPGTAMEQPKILQGGVEDAQMQPILEVARMMSDLREFQFASQMVDRESERLSNSIDRLTRRRN